jgi:hypothetical protein
VSIVMYVRVFVALTSAIDVPCHTENSSTVVVVLCTVAGIVPDYSSTVVDSNIRMQR